MIFFGCHREPSPSDDKVLTTDKSEINFGDQIKTTVSANFELKNPNEIEASAISFMSDSNLITIPNSADCEKLSPNEACTLKVKFTPNTADIILNSNITISYTIDNQRGNIIIKVKGNTIKTPPAIGVQDIRKNWAKESREDQIKSFNALKNQPLLGREARNNYTEALLWDSMGDGTYENDMEKFRVEGDKVSMQDDKGNWLSVDFDAGDKQALFNWMLARKLGYEMHWFSSGTDGVKLLNLLEQAARWNDFEFLKNYFMGDFIGGTERQLNSDKSTPLAFARSKEVAQLLLDKGADPDAQVRKLKIEGTKKPISVLDYLKISKAPQEVITLVESKKKK